MLYLPRLSRECGNSLFGFGFLIPPDIIIRVSIFRYFTFYHLFFDIYRYSSLRWCWEFTFYETRSPCITRVSRITYSYYTVEVRLKSQWPPDTHQHKYASDKRPRIYYTIVLYYCKYDLLLLFLGIVDIKRHYMGRTARSTYNVFCSAGKRLQGGSRFAASPKKWYLIEFRMKHTPNIQRKSIVYVRF